MNYVVVSVMLSVVVVGVPGCCRMFAVLRKSLELYFVELLLQWFWGYTIATILMDFFDSENDNFIFQHQIHRNGNNKDSYRTDRRDIVNTRRRVNQYPAFRKAPFKVS
jgi:hypothetical protein